MIFNREPVLILGFIQAVLGMSAAFALPLSGEQIGAIMAVAAAITAFIARSQVYSPETVKGIKVEVAEGGGA